MQQPVPPVQTPTTATPNSPHSACGGNGRPAMGCAMCMLITGPILILIGVVIILSPNAREDDVAEYNTAVSNFDEERGLVASITGTGFQTARGATTGAAFAPYTGTVRPIGSQDGVSTATSTFVQATLPQYDPNATGVTFNLSFGSAIHRDFPFSKESSVKIECDEESCSRGPGWCGGENRECTKETLDATCKRRYGLAAKYTGADLCDTTTLCGHCDFVAYATTLCAVVNIQGSNITEAPAAQFNSCFYPFTRLSNLYTHTVPSMNSQGLAIQNVNLQIRSSGDPFIVLQQIMEGSGDFGLTRRGQTNRGLVAIGVGIAFILAAAGTALYLWCHRDQKQGGEQVVGGAGQGQELYPQPQPYPVQAHSQPPVAYPYGTQQQPQPLAPGYNMQTQDQRQQPSVDGDTAPNGYDGAFPPPPPPPAHYPPQQLQQDQTV